MPMKNASTLEIVTVTVGLPLSECKVNIHKQKEKEWRKRTRVLVSFLDKGSTRISFREHMHIHIGKHIRASTFLGMLSFEMGIAKHARFKVIVEEEMRVGMLGELGLRHGERKPRSTHSKG